MIRCVFDTNIILAGLRSPTGASRELLRRLGRKEIRVLASVPMLLEYEDVLKRPEHLRSTNLTLEDVDVFIATVTTLIEPCRFTFCGGHNYVTQMMRLSLKPQSMVRPSVSSHSTNVIFGAVHTGLESKCFVQGIFYGGSLYERNKQLCLEVAIISF